MMTPKQARRHRDITQLEMARKLDVNVDTYRRIEKNPQKATIELAKKFCSIVDMKIDEIFFGDNSTKSRS